MKRFENLVSEFKGNECTFLKMVDAFEDATGDEVLNGIWIEDLLENESISFCIDTINYLNVEFEIVENNDNEPLETIIKITDISII